MAAHDGTALAGMCPPERGWGFGGGLWGLSKGRSQLLPPSLEACLEGLSPLVLPVSGIGHTTFADPTGAGL